MSTQGILELKTRAEAGNANPMSQFSDLYVDWAATFPDYVEALRWEAKLEAVPGQKASVVCHETERL
ncbi:hypothetical protein MMA231_01600 [Asticcacaulis sp. MM231]|uniref:hypothetical protein n=1 Tax=Asticcacaulis sp. MM231 TaxID=3157666 RepID=UPI0032D57D36